MNLQMKKIRQPDPRRAFRDGPPARRASPWLLAALLVVCAVPTSMAQGVEVGVSIMSFNDADLRHVYDPLFTPTVQVGFYENRWIRTSAGVAIAAAQHDTGRLAFVESGHSQVLFVPLFAEALAHYSLMPGVTIEGGPRAGFAFFKEDWEAEASDRSTLAKQDATGSWFTLGGVIHLRASIRSAGSAVVGFEWIWAHAERERVPGNESQNHDMSGGWRAVYAGWELPWRLW